MKPKVIIPKRKQKKYSAKIELVGSRTQKYILASFADATPKQITDIVKHTLQYRRLQYGKISIDFNTKLGGFGEGRTPLN